MDFWPDAKAAAVFGMQIFGHVSNFVLGKFVAKPVKLVSKLELATKVEEHVLFLVYWLERFVQPILYLCVNP